MDRKHFNVYLNNQKMGFLSLPVELVAVNIDRLTKDGLKLVPATEDGVEIVEEEEDCFVREDLGWDGGMES